MSSIDGNFVIRHPKLDDLQATLELILKYRLPKFLTSEVLSLGSYYTSLVMMNMGFISKLSYFGR